MYLCNGTSVHMSSPILTKNLLNALRLAAQDDKLLLAFLEDLLTPQEFEDIVVRWRIIQLLHQGMPQREIAAQLGVSISKITRGSKELLDPKGGFAQILQRM